jgi:hypothetical protein
VEREGALQLRVGDVLEPLPLAVEQQRHEVVLL